MSSSTISTRTWQSPTRNRTVRSRCAIPALTRWWLQFPWSLCSTHGVVWWDLVCLWRRVSSPSTEAKARSQNRRSNFRCRCRRRADVLDTAQILLRGCWLQLYPRRVCRCCRNSVAVGRTQWHKECSELVTFDVGAAARQQKRLLAELHCVQHGGKSCTPIVVTDDGSDDNRRSRTILLNASAAAHACAALCAFSRQFGTRCISDWLFFFAPDVATVVSRNLVDRCSWLPLSRRNAPRQFKYSTCGMESQRWWGCAWFLQGFGVAKRWASPVGPMELVEEDGRSSWEGSCSVLVFVSWNVWPENRSRSCTHVNVQLVGSYYGLDDGTNIPRSVGEGRCGEPPAGSKAHGPACAVVHENRVWRRCDRWYVGCFSAEEAAGKRLTGPPHTSVKSWRTESG